MAARMWTAVHRVEPVTRNPEGLLEWLLEAITSPNADRFQRRYDLEHLAHLVLSTPGIGYGRLPIDVDQHPADCIECGGSDDGAVIRDGHPYQGSDA